MAIKRLSIHISARPTGGDVDSIPIYFNKPQDGRPFFAVKWPGRDWHTTNSSTLAGAIDEAKSLYINRQKHSSTSLDHMLYSGRRRTIAKAVQQMPPTQQLDIQNMINSISNERMQIAVAGVMNWHNLNKQERSYIGLILSQQYLDDCAISHKSIEQKHQMFMMELDGEPGQIDIYKCKGVLKEIIYVRDNGVHPQSSDDAIKAIKSTSKKKAVKKKAVKKRVAKK